MKRQERQACHFFAAVGIVLGLVAAGLPAAAQDNPYGVDIHAPKGADLTRVMDKVRAAGVGWVNVGVVWPYVEGTRGVYDWRDYDAIVAAAQARGLRILAGIIYTPAWATSAPTWIGVPDTAAWVDFCTRAARRYKGSIDYWALWNEPNLAEFWQGTREQYIDQLLIPGADAIHAGNPQAKVGGPQLAHLGSTRWYDWLTEVITRAGGHLDFITHHVYDSGGNRYVTSKLNDSTLFGADPGLWSLDPPSLREVLENAGWVGKPVWLTETGWQSGQVGEGAQAAYYGGILSDWFTDIAGQTWINKIFFYEMEDPPNASTWGILNADGSPKRAYSAYQDFIASRGGPPPPAGDGAQLVAANVPKTMEAGQAITVSLTFRNTGLSTWTASAAYRLGADGNTDPFAPPRQLLGAGDSVAPGQEKAFTFNFTAPQAPGSYTTHWRMLREGVDWFGDQLVQQVAVNPAPAAAERTLSLMGGRFAATVSWHDPGSNVGGFGRAITGTDETGTFWFFSPTNTELVVKAVDGRAVNKHLWIFYGALSNVEYWLTVTDLYRGTVQTYHNPQGNLCGGADTGTFGRGNGASPPAELGVDAAAREALAMAPAWAAADRAASDRMALGPTVSDRAAAERVGLTPAPLDRESVGPAPQPLGHGVGMRAPGSAGRLTPSAFSADASGTCAGTAQNLCLLANRFQVRVTWRTLQGAAGSGTAANLSDQTGTFAFFDPLAVDLVVKVIDGRSLTGKFWFFYGALSDVDYRITILDTLTGSKKSYHNPQGNLCGVGDTSALD